MLIFSWIVYLLISCLCLGLYHGCIFQLVYLDRMEKSVWRNVDVHQESRVITSRESVHAHRDTQGGPVRRVSPPPPPPSPPPSPPGYTGRVCEKSKSSPPSPPPHPGYTERACKSSCSSPPPEYTKRACNKNRASFFLEGEPPSLVTSDASGTKRPASLLLTGTLSTSTSPLSLGDFPHPFALFTSAASFDVWSRCHVKPVSSGRNWWSFIAHNF